MRHPLCGVLRISAPNFIKNHVTILLQFIVILNLVTSKSGMENMNRPHLQVPPSHTALSGDLHVQVTVPPYSENHYQLRLYRAEGGVTSHLLYTTQVLRDARSQSNTTLVKVPCGMFYKGGEYYIDLVDTTLNETEQEDNKVSKGLDVRWPMPKLSLTPEHVQTYPESPVTAILEFPEVVCPPASASAPSAIPEFWLELHYCGHSLLQCDNHNSTNNLQILYSEQIRGFPGKRMLTLRCELFGLAGHYTLLLKPTIPMPSLSNTAAYVKADWSEQFVFNVHARSIMPCDPHSGGVTVLFQYPSCILSTGDRVRLYARLRADVASLSPPTSMEYVSEQRVTRGQHSLHFDCDLFHERYVEYCFVYVSQAITGAVADVRMDCVPTLPVSESESGGWGAWSPWTPCSTTCPGGTRNRYRFCDSPPPRYGAKFCEGEAVQTARCGNENSGNDWDCLYGAGVSLNGELPADRPEVKAEVGPGCRCGCVVHLGEAKPRRLIATSSQSCPGRTFWLIQADPDYFVRFKVDHFRLPCGQQWLKVRDGNSLSDTLLANIEGHTAESQGRNKMVQSSGNLLLLEFFSDELLAGGEACGGGFLAHASQIKPHNKSVSGIHVAEGAGLISAALPQAALNLTAVHIAALLLVSFVLVATALLGAQYLLRYRKYHIAEDMDSLHDSASDASANGGLALRARTSSSATLLSEVISLTRLRPSGRGARHTRLRESMDCEQEHGGNRETTCNEETGMVQAETESTFSSTVTLTPPMVTAQDLSTDDGESVIATPTATPTPTPSPYSERKERDDVGGSSKDVSTTEKQKSPLQARHRAISSSTLTKVRDVAEMNKGCYSPAASVISTATIRSTNPKESKEKRNRERLLQGPGSEFSLANPDNDMELDYYDYNVVNAGAAPGSYLGMDPAYLIWIPPLDDLSEIEDIRPKQYIDPGSNQESPEDEMLIPKIRRKSISEITVIDKLSDRPDSKKCSPEEEKLLPKRRKSIERMGMEKFKICLNDSLSDHSISPIVLRKTIKHNDIPLDEFPKKFGVNSPVRVHKPSEKETEVEKSPSYDIMDDIKFVDDECDEDVIENECNKNSYQDSNIIMSNDS